MKAVIMAGGKGTRLRPLTCDLPKPMVPILNYPVMEHIINLLKKQGITEIAVTTFYLPQIIRDYFGNGEKWGVSLRYYIEESPLGTAGSVHNADEFLDETFLVISGDAITDFDLNRGIEFHRQKQADATLVLSREEIPLDYGVVITDDDGEIIRFLEKPNWGQVFSDTINTGIYVLEPDIFNLYDKGEKFDFSKDLFPLMLEKQMELYGIALTGYWNDIGDLKEYHQTQFDFLRGEIDLPLTGSQKLRDDIWIEEDVEIADTARLQGPLYIGEGTSVGEEVVLQNSVLGRNNLIKANSSLKNSVIWNNNYFGTGVEIRGGIITDNVTLKDRVCVFDHTAIGRKVTVDREARIKPGVKIWPEKTVEEQTEVEHSIVWSPRWTKQLFSNVGVVGQSNVDIAPEFVAKLATAYGSTLKKDQSVTVSGDRYKISNALKSAFIAGLRTAGIRTVDLGPTITPVVRYSITKLNSQGGVHLRVSHKNPENVVIEFLNSQGVNISSGQQKSIEKKFFAEDYNRSTPENVGEYSHVPEMNNRYIEEILDRIEAHNIRRNFFSIVVDYEYDNLYDILPRFLKKLNCRTYTTRNLSGNELPLSLENRLKIRESIARIMRDNRADLGIIIDHNGENLKLVSRRGKVLETPGYRVLISYLLLERGVEELYLPLNSPRVIEKIAGEYEVKVNYTPVRPQAPMRKYFNALEEDPPYFYPYTDAIYGLGLVLAKMARDDVSFDSLLEMLPEFHLNNVEIPCDWQDKGRIMRHLSDNVDDNSELIDGVKFNHKRGWALVIPDSEKPVFHIYAEGEDAEAAASLTGQYREKIKNLLETKEG